MFSLPCVLVACPTLQEGVFALDVALTTLSFFSEYFGTPYALPKSDLVAIPDFAAGAMVSGGPVPRGVGCRVGGSGDGGFGLLLCVFAPSPPPPREDCC